MSDKLFLYNYVTQSKVPAYYTKFATLKESLEHYANDLLYPKNLKFTQAKDVCLHSNLIIQAYKTKNFKKLKNTIGLPKLKAAQIYSELMHNEYNFDLIFRDFVHGKIVSKNADKKVYCKNSLIIIENGDEKLGIMTNYKKVDINNLNSLKCDIAKALDIKQNQNLQNLYIVCPRNLSFRKHIEIKTQNSDYMGVKIVPYTLTNLKIKEKR
ncbi:hypothetical protein CSPB12327_02585 [Campylobacter sp. RM12327]|uniref:hypothetical protein n=1 Tax=Campylobacter sputorum TaxID=206 RepID=UPI000B77848A|nr:MULTISPECIES: hypothetical protein [Campylobacter]ASM40580.1 hypothetical protein CSPB_1389 [Campylobacter sputorum]MBE7357755.1 hypothetical protein [Campylobacter sp. RM11302]MBF6669033.1 hypothetical protein [Campylobacter sp. RM12327]MBF6673958.1 hypothetical protein [Campylobacter sp. RM13538]MBF6675773.1 hypothetical protein [Campylobacter sp. RM12321]